MIHTADFVHLLEFVFACAALGFVWGIVEVVWKKPVHRAADGV